MSAGERQIEIELEGDSGKIEVCRKKYEKLLSELIVFIEENGGKKGMEEALFIDLLIKSFKNILKMEYDTKQPMFLHESLETNKWNCNTRSFLAFDAGKKMGIDTSMILPPGHAMLVFGKFLFETTSCFRTGADDVWLSLGVLKSEEEVQTISYINRGMLRAGKGEFERAILDYKRAIELHPKSLSARVNAGLCYTKLKYPKKAEKIYREAIDIAPLAHEAYLNLAALLWSMGKNEEALEASEQAVKACETGFIAIRKDLQPKACAMAHIYGSLILSALGRKNESKESLDKAREWDNPAVENFFRHAEGIGK